MWISGLCYVALSKILRYVNFVQMHFLILSNYLHGGYNGGSIGKKSREEK